MGPVLRIRQQVPGRGWQVLTLEGHKSSVDDGSRTNTSAQHALHKWADRGMSAMSSGFLPHGYPKSVSQNYLPYVGWTCVSLLTGRMQSVLATQAALFTVGLGAGSIPLAAAIQWILKDGVGHAGAIVYATSVNTRFDADAKRYRFQATLALTVADFVAVLMPLVPQHFFLLASLSSTTSSIANLATVSARARIMACFAKQGNLADCVRAGQTQGKLMSLLGTGAGAAFSWTIGAEPSNVILAMVPLAAASVYATHRSSCLVVLPSLNLQRCELVYAELLRATLPQMTAAAAGVVSKTSSMRTGLSSLVAPSDLQLQAPSPEEVAALERFALPYRSVLPSKLLLQPVFDNEGTSSWLPFRGMHISALGHTCQHSNAINAFYVSPA